MFRRKSILIDLFLGMSLCAMGLPLSRGADDAPGIQVGQQAPDFTLKSHHGEDVALKQLLQQGKLALVFYRSADW